MSLILLPFWGLAQGTSQIYGIVSTNENSLEGAVVFTSDNKENLSKTDEKGFYQLKLNDGKYKLVFKAKGYQDKQIIVNVKKGESKRLNVKLESESYNLDEVILNRKSAIQQIKESPFNVVALDAKVAYNSTQDLAQLLDKASGVKVRESGGIGSDMSISLNGFTGNHVKLFMDGVPMQGFGSAFQLNNIPVGIADRIEVYKGVVPIEFGTDALGGVINIVTNQNRNTSVDASYAYGSFNTHKTNISFNHTTKSGFTIRANANQSYSDNDYKVKTTVLNLQTGNRPDELHWVKRFNDAYHNEAISLKTGFVKKSWADQLLFGFTYGQDYKEIQHTNLMSIVFGEKNTKSTSYLYSISYEKKNLFTKGLNLRFNANYNETEGRNYDTINRQYNWYGEYITSNTKGEYGQNTLAKYQNKNLSSSLNIGYQINKYHSISINDLISTYKRKNDDAAAVAEPGTVLDTVKRTNLKNVLGISYRYQPNKKWISNLFLKQYNVHVTGPVNISTQTNRETLERQNRSFSTTGYGFATTYNFEDLQFKASIEKAYRLPTDQELFGDEVLESGNVTLQAEESLNYNLGAIWNKLFNENSSVYIDVNGYYRDTKNFIRRIIDARYGSGGSVNFGKVTNIGIDAEIRYYYKNNFTIGGNVTYQNLRNKEKYEKINTTQPSATYNDRMPNIPYFFGNADATYYFHDLWKKGNTLSIGYTFNYVGEFYQQFESLGYAGSKNKLPEQMWNDASVTYSLQNGRYNFTFEAKNINNALLFDNFSLQKPGRSFFVKFRYFFNRRK